MKNIRYKNNMGLMTILLTASSCASITEVSSQLIKVSTTPVEGSRCELQNPKGTWVVEKTPGSATVNKARGIMTVTCTNPNGKGGTRTAESDTKAEVFGNAMIGGGIGAVADMSTGAAYIYPAEIKVDLNGNNPPIVSVSSQPPQTKQKSANSANHEGESDEYPDKQKH
jgi:hypothetical protein